MNEKKNFYQEWKV